MPRGIRAPMGDAKGCALGDRLRQQYRQFLFKLCLVHRRRRAEEDAVRLRRAVLLQGDDVPARCAHEAVDLDAPRAVDACDDRGGIERPPTRDVDLEDERTTPTEHPGIDVLATHPVERVPGAAGLLHHLGGDDLLDARRVHLARTSAPRAALALASAAGPPGLRDATGELPVPATEEEGVHLDLDVVERGIHNRDDLGLREVRLLPREVGDPLADLPVELRLHRLRLGDAELRPEGLLPRLQLRIDLRPDHEGPVLPGLEGPGRDPREVVEAVEQALAQAAYAFRQADLRTDRAAALRVRVAVADLAEEPAEAGVAEGPLPELRPVHAPRGLQDLVHVRATAGRLKGSREADGEREREVREDDCGDRHVAEVALLRVRDQAQGDAPDGREEEDEHTEVHQARGRGREEGSEEVARGDRGPGERPLSRGMEEEGEDDERQGQDDPAPEHVVDEAVDVLDLCHRGASERLEPPDHPDDDVPRPDHASTSTPNARRAMRRPSAARRTAKANRIRSAFARIMSFVPRFDPVNAPMITTAANVT